MKKILLALMLVILFAVPAYGLGSCTQTVKTSYTPQDRVADAVTAIVTITCIADSGGSATFPTATIALVPSTTTNPPYNLYGYYLYQVGRTPGNVSSSQLTCSVACPTTLYTVTITDTQGYAIDLGLLTSNGSASVAQLTLMENTSTGYPVIRSAPTVAITGNGATNYSATVTLDLIFKAR
jgi:hypothetical protein